MYYEHGKTNLSFMEKFVPGDIDNVMYMEY